MLTRILLSVGMAVVAGAMPAQGPRLDPIAPCCAVTAVNHKAGTVRVQVNKTDQTFEVQFPTAVIAQLKVGDSLDLARRSSSPNVPQPETATPCCAVVSTDIRAGTSVVRLIKTGQTIAVPIAARLLKGLKAGDRLDLVRTQDK